MAFLKVKNVNVANVAKVKSGEEGLGHVMCLRVRAVSRVDGG